MTADRPVGYWLKHLDRLLERQFEEALADVSLTRRDWQVLDALAAGATTRAGLHEALAPFWTAGNGPGPDEVLAVLTARGLTGQGTDLGLTDEGRAIHTRALERVERTRSTVLTGLTPEEYAGTVRVLSVMAANAEADLAAR
ncbi:MarR family transcriptional regulator [Streptomyces niveiscabiei]|uniref:MarR family transcriptional regulator n=1 Tax=Streptomyces niveiscabiei TaxID=164115 RepID=UPI0029B5D623|nr:MarR family transcriptional regulator [Streptomyces niveiscabiei]MDX3384300.1 MarR family transcriptional regulator [Streptomyces niveiscabiei]